MPSLYQEKPLNGQTLTMSGAEKVNILVVDDLPEKLLVLESVLAELGESTVTARSGEEALRLVLEQDFAVILLDVNMPGMDGLEAAAYIRRRRKSAHTPIIFITAFADELHTAQGYSLGAVDYILSPIVPEVLRTKVKVFVDLFRMTQQVRRQADERIALIREQTARAAAEETMRRSTFLAEASTVLTSSLDLETTQRGLLELVVPALADLASVTLVGEHSQPWHSELAWVFPPDQTVQSSSLLSSEATDDALRRALEEVLDSGKPKVLEHLDVRYPPEGCGRFGSPPEARLRSALIFPLLARGQILGAFTLAQGGSDRRFNSADRSMAEDLAGRAAVALDNARLYRDIQEVDRRKSDFLAMLSHELRNPLAPIRNAVQILRLLGLKDPDLTQARDMIDRQVTHMSRLIDDLLDMSRLSRGKILLRKEGLDLMELVRDTVDDYRSFLEANDVRLELQLPERPLYTEGDATRLAQVIGNVLHNASKFTDSGGQVAVTLTASADDTTAVISIRDTGIGVEPEMLARMFDSFTQADGSLDRSRGGLGLGLALVKGLVEMHGGTVAAYSGGLGQGTEVTIRLPLTAAPATPRRPARPARTSAEGLRILVIEDNPDTAESMRVLLSLSGHEVEVALNGLAGMEAAHRHQPEVVLCDIGLPGGMDGYAVARALRKDPILSRAFLIAATGYGQEEDQRRCQEAGFDAHFTKPLDFTELQRVLASLPARACSANQE
jgi:signal transduction histidine kinase/DNA-binding response OmpR family regulator